MVNPTAVALLAQPTTSPTRSNKSVPAYPRQKGYAGSLRFIVVTFLATLLWGAQPSHAATPLKAAVAKVDITDHQAGPVHDPSHARILLLEQDGQRSVIISVDAVAVAELGRLANGFMDKLRARLKTESAVDPQNLIVNASHCHSIVRPDSADLIADATASAAQRLTPVLARSMTTENPRISENRRLLLADRTESDMRRAYPTAPSADLAETGPIDPTIAILSLSRTDGSPLAVVYHFACHPIMNPPSFGNSADISGIASHAIEETLGHGAVALFIQGCGGDINPRGYKDPSHPTDAQPLANELALSVLTALSKGPPPASAQLKTQSRIIDIPRGRDFADRIRAVEEEQMRLLRGLKSTPLEFDAFVPMWIQDHLQPSHPSAHQQSYLHDRSIRSTDRSTHDADRRTAMQSYRSNLSTLEQLIRLNANLALLKKHEAAAKRSAMAPLKGELCGLKLGDFRLVTFPGELTVEVGLGIKRLFPDRNVFVAGYTNGYLYYLPTAQQRANKGFAQEDCDCDVAPEWQSVFEKHAADVIRNLDK